MNLQILLFGIATDLIGTSSIELTLPENSSVIDLKTTLANKYPSFQKLDAFAVAVDETYAKDDLILTANNIVAIIPPVSGG